MAIMYLAEEITRDEYEEKLDEIYNTALNKYITNSTIFLYKQLLYGICLCYNINLLVY